MRVTWAVASHPGLRRPVNEDSYIARPDLGLFGVADGMGGHAAGDIASRLATSSVERFLDDAGPSVDADDAERLTLALRHANATIGATASQDFALKGMATTASLVCVPQSGLATVAHVGDTRIYLARQASLTRLTDDHSWVEEQVRAGALDRAAAARHPWRSVVTRALSGADDLVVDIRRCSLHAGDRLMLCSDGLHGTIDDTALRETLSQADDLDRACATLVAAANAAGGPDNITVLLLEIHAD